MENLVYSGPLASYAIVSDKLGKIFNTQYAKADAEHLYPLFRDCAVFLDASMKVPITAELIGEAKNLKLVITATTGANHIDHKALEKRAIPLMTLRDHKEKLNDITAAAEHSWMLLLACARKLRGAIRHTEECLWNRESFPGTMLKGKTIGIIGLGRIGAWISRYAAAFGMNVIGYDPYMSMPPSGVMPVGLEQLFETADIVTVHVNLTNENRGLVNRSLLDRAKKGCIFINTSRSELVDENALVDILAEGKIGAVGADVISGEPAIKDSPLWQYARTHDNVVITPHVGGFCPEAVDIVVALTCDRIRVYFIGNK